MWINLFLRHEPDGQRIDAVPGIFGRHLLAVEDMAQMPAAFCTQNFLAQAIGICLGFNGTRKMVVKAGPTATGVKFCRRGE